MLNFQFVIITYFNTLFFDDFFGISSRHLACLVVIYNLVPVIFYREMLIVRYRHFLVMTTFLFAPHIHRLAQPHRYLLVVTNGFRVVMLNVRRPVVKYLRVHVLLRVDIDLFLIRRILKAQLVKPASFIGLRPYRHLRLRPRQVPW